MLTHSQARVKTDFCQCSANILESDKKFDGQTHFEYDEPSTSGLSLDADWLIKSVTRPSLEPEVVGFLFTSTRTDLFARYVCG